MSFTRIIISIALLEIGFMSANYLEAESNYMKPKLERNNILNKKVWIKNQSRDNLSEKSNGGQYIFRSNSIAAEDVLQNNFDSFNDNFIQDIPFVSSYIQRTKRSSNDMRKVRPRKSLKNCINKGDCRLKTISYNDDQLNQIGSQLTSDLKPQSIFNYPNEATNLLNNKKDNKTDDNIATRRTHNNKTSSSREESINFITIEGNNQKNNSKSNLAQPKRRSKYDYETDNNDRIEFMSNYNDTNDNMDRGKLIHNDEMNDDTGWHQRAPIPDVNLYRVIPKEPVKKQIVSEKALIKIISTLTKTFKKIMKQHNDMKTIHHKVRGLNDNLLINVANVSEKFQDFDKKYLNLLELNERIKKMESDSTVQELKFKNKETEIAKSFRDFENQQKKFLAQQKQFYTIQQMILAQNEKINMKQSLIAKTQSEISHRQNNFARILKKAKQINSDNRNNPTTDSNLVQFKNEPNELIPLQIKQTSTSLSPSSESVKINLFSIPVANTIRNQDDILMKEKDRQPIDDLIYKFYFNNTFIDNLMKSKVLNPIAHVTEDRQARHNVKNKRNELKRTVLLPVNKTNIHFSSRNGHRNKRWINHYSRNHNKRKNHTKADAVKSNLNSTNSTNLSNGNETDPFLAMATSFCNAIRRNANSQVLSWCIEKALRRLQYMDAKLFPMYPSAPVDGNLAKPSVKKDITTASSLPRDLKQSISTVSHPLSPGITGGGVADVTTETTDMGQNSIFFPDNDELELQLKQYELKPDTEGNVYYEGSHHASEIDRIDSEDNSDFLPDLYSNSKVDMSPYAFDYQARRYGYIM